MPATVSDWKTSTHEMSGVLKIEHFYWGKMNAVVGGGYVRGIIKFFNVSQIPMANVKVLLDLDDTGMTWDAIIVNSGGSPVPGGLVDLGYIPPGSYAEKKYWWKVQHLFGPTNESFEVTFNIIPQFEILYTKNNAFKDKANVNAT